MDFLTTEVSTSKQKKFPLITFIDTPGLVDGDMEYPFDVDTAVTLFGDMADLIFVLFDPIGQALCKRTLNIVGELSFLSWVPCELVFVIVLNIIIDTVNCLIFF